MAASMLSSVLRRVLINKCPAGGASFTRTVFNGADRRAVSSRLNNNSYNWRKDASRRTGCCVLYSGSRNQSDQNSWTSAALGGAMAFSLFNMFEEEDTRTEAQKQEDEIILLLKKAKLSMYRGQLQAASDFLHEAVALAHRTHNNQAIIYTYSLMANLAYVQGQLDKAEKLFKAAMSFMLSGGTPQDDNGVIEISLKLATIYAGQNKRELADIGYSFCIDNLEAKLLKHKELPEDELTEEAEALRKETRLLLGLCLDSRARYRASTQQLTNATLDYEQALLICDQEQGQTHPQTLVLMSDLATILDLQGRHDDALPWVAKAVELSRTVGHPDHHVLLSNMAGILLHQDRLDESVSVYKEALSLAQAAGDEEAVEQVQQGMDEVKKKRDQLKNKTKEQETQKPEETPIQSA